MTSAVDRRRRIPTQLPTDMPTAYAVDVVEGRIVAGKLVRAACQRHLDDLRTGKRRGLVWDSGAAEHAIRFFLLLRHYKGRWGPRAGQPGKRVELEPWQAFIVGCLFGWKNRNGTRRFRTVYVEVAKKNGKTLLAAGLMLLLAFFDDEPGADVFSAASKRDQAKLSWLDAKRMVAASPALSRRLSTLAGSIIDETTYSSFKPLGRDADSDQGINPHAVVVDELHILKDRDLVENIESGTASRDQPVVLYITTAGVKRESIWAELRKDAAAVVEGREVDDTQLVAIYTLDEGDDPFDEAVWPKSNPNLGVSVNVATLRTQAAAARRSPGKLAAFLRFRMNVPTSVSTLAIDMDEWDLNSDAPRVEDGQGGYGGLDLASVRDLTALVLVFLSPDGHYDVLCWFWCPEDGIVERSRRDGVPYADWVRDGLLVATPGNVTDYAFIREAIKEIGERYHIGEIAYDKWNATQLVTELEQDGASCVPIPQTHAGLGPAWRELDKIVLDHKMRHGGHPILRWMAGNVEVEIDAVGNEKPSKRHSSERIDGMIGLDMAVGRWMANGEPRTWTAA